MGFLQWDCPHLGFWDLTLKHPCKVWKVVVVSNLAGISPFLCWLGPRETIPKISIVVAGSLRNILISTKNIPHPICCFISWLHKKTTRQSFGRRQLRHWSVHWQHLAAKEHGWHGCGPVWSTKYGVRDVISGWWFGPFFIFHILGISSSQLTFIFFRGVGQPPTS